MFKFKFEKLLNIRKKEEEEAGKRLSVKLKEIEIEKERLSLIKKEKEELKKRMRAKSILAGEIQQIHSSLIGLETKEKELSLKIDVLKSEAENLRLELLEARKKRKILESLRDRLYRKYMEEERRKEQKLLDELGVNKFARRS